MDTEESPTTEKVARDLELERVIYYWQFLTPYQKKKLILWVRYIALRHRIENFIQSIIAFIRDLWIRIKGRIEL